MNFSLARIFSILGHPLLVLTYMLLLMLMINPFAFGAQHIGDRDYGFVFSALSTTFLIPGLGVSLLRPLGLIHSLERAINKNALDPISSQEFFICGSIKISVE